MWTIMSSEEAGRKGRAEAAAKVFGVFVGLRSQKRSPGSGQAMLDTSMELEEVETVAVTFEVAGCSAAWNWSDVGSGAAEAEAAAGAGAAAAAEAPSSSSAALAALAAAPSSPFSSSSLSFLFSASSFSILASADSRLLLSDCPDALAASCPRKDVPGRSGSSGCRVVADRRRAAIDAEPDLVFASIAFIVPPLTAAAGRIDAAAVVTPPLRSPVIEQCACVSKFDRENPAFRVLFSG